MTHIVNMYMIYINGFSFLERHLRLLNVEELCNYNVNKTITYMYLILLHKYMWYTLTAAYNVYD